MKQTTKEEAEFNVPLPHSAAARRRFSHNKTVAIMMRDFQRTLGREKGWEAMIAALFLVEYLKPFARAYDNALLIWSNDGSERSFDKMVRTGTRLRTAIRRGISDKRFLGLGLSASGETRDEIGISRDARAQAFYIHYMCDPIREDGRDDHDAPRWPRDLITDLIFDNE